MAKTTGKVTIKKYANRRLYDTESSSYITLDRLAAMIREGREFEVLDAKSGDDITHQVLTQIIVDEEARGSTLLPVNFLRELIGMYGLPRRGDGVVQEQPGGDARRACQEPDRRSCQAQHGDDRGGGGGASPPGQGCEGRRRGTERSRHVARRAGRAAGEGGQARRLSPVRDERLEAARDCDEKNDLFKS